MLQESTNVIRTGHAKCVTLNILCIQYHSRTRPSAAMCCDSQKTAAWRGPILRCPRATLPTQPWLPHISVCSAGCPHHPEPPLAGLQVLHEASGLMGRGWVHSPVSQSAFSL